MAFEVDEFDLDDDLDLDTLFEGISIEQEKNVYIKEDWRAIQLLADLIRNDRNYSQKIIREIKKEINGLFDLISKFPIKRELEYYQNFQDLCARLAEQQKLRKLHNKVVIGFGGKFSAGKSKFINAISGIGELLPVAQKPTTSIPTYIMKSDRDCLTATSVDGYTTILNSEKMGALTHEFHDTYKIGFSAFVDCILAESSTFALSERITLLDTPGYTKYDNKSDTKLSISDRKRAFEQLRTSDYLIWLIDISTSSEVGLDDITFLKELDLSTPVLVVFTKADLRPESIVEESILKAKNTLYDAGVFCYGVTAYSSNLMKEYGAVPLIPGFFTEAVKKDARNNDVLGEFSRLAKALRQELVSMADLYEDEAKNLFAYISKSQKIMDIQSLTELWGHANQAQYEIRGILNQYDRKISEITEKISGFIRGGTRLGS